MSQNRRLINRTSTLPNQNEYTLALENELNHVAFSEERAPANKNLWRKKIFDKPDDSPMDLEIGTGNGTFFAHQALKHPERLLLGIEVKYKPLIQTIRRSLRQGSQNTAVIRYHAFNIEELFAEGELNNIFIHFPDPWVTPRKPKNRLVSLPILEILYRLQRPGSFINFKTDSREYFLWAMEEIRKSSYKIEFETQNLHKSEWQSLNFETAFEKIFLRQGVEINFVRLVKS